MNRDEATRDMARTARDRFETSGSGWVLDNGVEFTLYDAVACLISPDDTDTETTSWTVGVELAPGVKISTLLGHDLTGLQDPAKIDKALDVLDEYARTRLGKAYLKEFEAGVKRAAKKWGRG